MTFARGCAFRPANHYGGGYYNQGKNGAWLGLEWVNQAHSESEISTLANELTHEQIRYVFVYTSYLHTDTLDFKPTFAYAAAFINAFRQAQPKIQVLAWLGVPMPSLGGVANLADLTIRKKVAAISAYLVQAVGFDGIQLDPEIVTSGDQHLIALLDETRQAIGSHALLSLAAEKIQPVFPDLSLLGAHIGWSKAYYRQIAQHVDQLAVMAYDTRLRSDGLYRELLRFEVIGLSQALADTGVTLLFGVAASDEASDTHSPATENIANGLQGVIDGLNDLETVPNSVSGVAIYPAWAMNSTKWAYYETYWLQ